MEIAKCKSAYHTQRRKAARRGIEFLLTFQQWMDFWGDDIDRRGSGPCDLQMQRFADTGPYAIGNIRKGTPRDNAKTRGNMWRKRKAEEAAAEVNAALDRAMFEESADKKGLKMERALYQSDVQSSYHRRFEFCG